MSFKGKVVLITGASAGIGAATAVLFAKEGASVAIVGRNEVKLNSVAEICNNIGAPTLPIIADITGDEQANDVIQKTLAKFGKLDVLINNAGVLRKANILDKDYMESYDLIMNTNMRAIALTINLAAPHIIKTKGNIINISSIGATFVSEHFSAYKISKAALDHFTKNIALELSSYGVRVNAVSPGPVVTDIFDAAGLAGSFMDYLKDATALSRLSESEEISDLILYLASDKAKSVTGSIFVIDNGMLLKQTGGK